MFAAKTTGNPPELSPLDSLRQCGKRNRPDWGAEQAGVRTRTYQQEPVIVCACRVKAIPSPVVGYQRSFFRL
jgi:hypothetical protein